MIQGIHDIAREVLREHDARSISTWDVHPDGQRFAIARPARSTTDDRAGSAASFRVVLDWFEDALAREGR